MKKTKVRYWTYEETHLKPEQMWLNLKDWSSCTKKKLNPKSYCKLELSNSILLISQSDSELKQKTPEYFSIKHKQWHKHNSPKVVNTGNGSNKVGL